MVGRKREKQAEGTYIESKSSERRSIGPLLNQINDEQVKVYRDGLQKDGTAGLKLPDC